MKWPRKPRFLATQHWNGRRYDTGDMLDVLTTYHGIGMRRKIRVQSWHWRLLIRLHREENERHAGAGRKGYGKDWRENIKPAVIDYEMRGRLPYHALEFAAKQILTAEMDLWRTRFAERLATRCHHPFAVAAE